FGENLFTIEINKERRVDELTFANNTVAVNKFLQLSGTMNLLPLDFGIVNQEQIDMVSQIPGKSVLDRNIVLQIDSTADFSSSARRETRITTSGLAKWTFDLSEHFFMKDSVTFYWRSRFLDPREGEDDGWAISSFSYIRKGPEGWTKRVLPQFGNNTLDNLYINSQAGEWNYEKTNLELDVFTFGPENPDFTYNQTQI